MIATNLKTFSLASSPKSYSVYTAAGRPIYTAAIPTPPVVTIPQTGQAPGGPGVQPAQALMAPAPGVVDTALNFVKANPLLIIAGAVVVGLLLQKKRSR